MSLQVQFNYKHVLRDPSPYLFLLVPSLNQSASFAREHSEHSFRVSRVLDLKRDRLFHEISRFMGEKNVNFIPNN